MVYRILNQLLACAFTTYMNWTEDFPSGEKDGTENNNDGQVRILHKIPVQFSLFRCSFQTDQSQKI